MATHEPGSRVKEKRNHSITMDPVLKLLEDLQFPFEKLWNTRTKRNVQIAPEILISSLEIPKIKPPVERCVGNGVNASIQGK